MLMMPHGWRSSSPQLTAYADFWHPTGWPLALDFRKSRQALSSVVSVAWLERIFHTDP